MDLNITEKFIILTIHPKKGSYVITPDYRKFGIAGAILMDLEQSGKVSISDNRLKIMDYKLSTDRVFNSIMKFLKRPDKERRIRYWIRILSRRTRSIRREVLKTLERKKILRIEDRKFLNIFQYKRYFFWDSNIQKELVANLRECLFNNKRKRNDEENMLLGLIKVCNLSKVIANRQERKIIRGELKDIVKQNSITKSVRYCIREMHAVIGAAAT